MSSELPQEDNAKGASKISAFITLSKPRILVLVVLMTAAGYFLGGESIDPVGRFAITLFATALSSAGAAALNNLLECESDLLMERTRSRAIPSGVIKPGEALLFGSLLALSGAFILALWVNLLTGFVSLLTTFLYVAVYTPLKRISWWNTVIGAVPGALPPLGGWCAATGEVGLGAWLVFLMLFIWQHPHFYAIAWMYRDDYARGGFRMLPVEYPDGVRTFRQALGFSIVLIPVSVLPYIFGVAGGVYCIGVIILGVWMLSCSVRLWRSRSIADARGLLQASVIYLTLFFALIVCDRSL
jgi:protoheme IX farnesyltransferase